MIALFTDYGVEGPYLGEVQATLFQYAPGEKVVNLFADVPRQDPKAGAYLLAAYHRSFPRGTIFFCVVDPGVGSGEDTPIAVRLDRSYWFVGPHNGLFDIVTRGGAVDCWEITYRPRRLSSSFHGRDLYAPVCTMIANQQPVPGRRMEWRSRYAWPDDLSEIIYVDHFGNCMTGTRADRVDAASTISVAGREMRNARTFASVKKGQAFWYANSVGLIEIAVNRGNASAELGLAVGTAVSIAV